MSGRQLTAKERAEMAGEVYRIRIKRATFDEMPKGVKPHTSVTTLSVATTSWDA